MCVYRFIFSYYNSFLSGTHCVFSLWIILFFFFIAFLFPAACLSFLGLLFPGDISSVFLSLFFFFFGDLPFEDICYLFPANIAECLSLFPFPVLSFSFVLCPGYILSFFLLSLFFSCIFFILLIP